MLRDSRLFVAVVGAGPYGLSIGAHLREITKDVRVFGRIMDTWLSRMPNGMFLKSEGFASNLSDPHQSYTLKSYCASHNLEYDDYVFPVPIDTFRRYGQSFQRDLVPDVEEKLVISIVRNTSHFELELDNGEVVHADNVVVAPGFGHFAFVPSEFGGLPTTLVSHSADHVDFARFKGQDVTVIGAGQSALETAALLHEQGSNARVLARRPSIEWNRLPTNRSLLERFTKPRSPLGRGRRAWVYSYLPAVFRHLPEARRLDIVRHAQGPAGGWWLKERVVGKIPLIVSTTVVRAEQNAGRVKLELRQDQTTQELITDHVIAATGFVVDIRRLRFLAPTLVAGVRHLLHTPILSSAFESSVPGLYFVGLASANTFGPIMRFAAGATPAARRMARHFRHRTRAH